MYINVCIRFISREIIEVTPCASIFLVINRPITLSVLWGNWDLWMQIKNHRADTKGAHTKNDTFVHSLAEIHLLGDCGFRMQDSAKQFWAPEIVPHGDCILSWKNAYWLSWRLVNSKPLDLWMEWKAQVFLHRVTWVWRGDGCGHKCVS